LKWDMNMAEKARKTHTFIRVNSAPDAKGGSFRQLSGARRLWDSGKPEGNVIFLTDVRVTGTRADVEEALSRGGYDRNQISTFLANAITRDNYDKSMKGSYDSELAAHNQVLSEKKDLPPPDWHMIKALALNLKDARSITKGGSSSAVSPSRKKAGAPTGPRATSLREKYSALPANKQLDVSKFDGTKGARQEAVPAPSKPGKVSRTGKVSSSYIGGIVSSNFDSYVLALRVIFGQGPTDATVDNQDPYNAAIQEVYAKLNALNVQPQAPAPLVPAPGRVTAPAPIAVGQRLAVTPKPRPTVPSVSSPPLRTVGGGGLTAFPSLRR